MTGEEKRRAFQDADWLHGTVWRWDVYRKPRQTWTHEHCVFCSRRIAEPGGGDTDALPEAWTTTFIQTDGVPGYEWVCPSCFAQLRGPFLWRVAGPDTEYFLAAG